VKEETESNDKDGGLELGVDLGTLGVVKKELEVGVDGDQEGGRDRSGKGQAFLSQSGGTLLGKRTGGGLLLWLRVQLSWLIQRRLLLLLWIL